MKTLDMLRAHRDSVQDEYLDACCDMRYSVEELNDLRNILVDLDEQIANREFYSTYVVK